MPGSSRVAVYTAVFGDYDRPRPVTADGSASFICFTDNNTLTVDGWETRHFDQPSLTAAQKNRYCKMLPHLVLPDFDTTLYLDGNIDLLRSPIELIERYQTGPLFALRHTERDCAYAEGRRLLAAGSLDDEQTARLQAQLSRYQAAGFPEHFGLSENGVLLRRRSEEIDALMEAWWAEFHQSCRRDQVSLPFVCWRHGHSMQFIEEHPRRRQPYFDIRLHHGEDQVSGWKKLRREARLRKYRNPMNWAIATLSEAGDRLVQRSRE